MVDRWLFDRVVESPHRTSFYARNIVDMEDPEMQEAARYWFVPAPLSPLLLSVFRYNGRPTPPPNSFLPEMEEACEIIEKTVKEEIRKRGDRYPMEWPATVEHPWMANVAAANCYTGSKETVGFHSDQSVVYKVIYDNRANILQADLLGTMSHYSIFVSR